MFGIPVYVFSALLLGAILIILVFSANSSIWGDFSFFRSSMSRFWSSPYECGCLATSWDSPYMGFSYMGLLVFFVVFDLEVVLLLNVPFHFGFFKSFWYYFIFLFFLLLGYSIEVGRGYVDWRF